MDLVEAAIARAREKAGPRMAESFVHPQWAMDAAGFRAFWGGTRLAGVSTVGVSGHPHVAPVEVTLQGDRFVVPTYADTVRLADLRANPRLSLIAWDDAWHAVIVYGRAEAEGLARGSVVVSPERIYGMRAPAGHHASQV